MIKLIKYAALAFLVALAGIQLVRPPRTNPATDATRTLFARTSVPPAAKSVLERACRDCHSNDTTWPWYSHVAPTSWLVIDHVNHGRRHFNYSDWAQYDAEKAKKIRHDICEQVQGHEMPLGWYLIVHRNARLTDSDIAAVCEWTKSPPAATGLP